MEPGSRITAPLPLKARGANVDVTDRCRCIPSADGNAEVAMVEVLVGAGEGLIQRENREKERIVSSLELCERLLTASSCRLDPRAQNLKSVVFFFSRGVKHEHCARWP